MIGSIVGGHKLVKRLGKGGMGIVFRAEDQTSGHQTAVKVLHRHLSEQKELVTNFFQEARAAAALGHRGLVDVYGCGFSSDGTAYVAMELLAGESLEVRLKRGALSVPEALRILLQATSALSAAHQMGIVHRDLKPSNIFIVADPSVPGGERIKLLDFGISKLAGETKPGGVMTRDGIVMGTPDFMAPEQCHNAADIDGRADLYALGCVLFSMICGRPPFLGELAGDVLEAQKNDPPPHPRQLVPAVSEELERLILRLLEKQPNDRFQSADELRGALREMTRKLPALEPAQIAPPGAAPHVAPIAHAVPAADPVKPRKGGAKSKRRNKGGNRKKGKGNKRSAPAHAAGPPVSQQTGPAAVVPVSPPSLQHPSAVAVPHPRAASTPLKPVGPQVLEPKPESKRTAILVASGLISLVLGGGAAILVSTGDSKTSSQAATPPIATTPVALDAAAPIDAPPPPPLKNPWKRVEPPAFNVVLGIGEDEAKRVPGFRPGREIEAPMVPYEIQEREVSRAMFEAFVAAHPEIEVERDAGDAGDDDGADNDDSVDPADMPAVGMSQPAAAAYCASLGGALPTEEQWEYAARGPVLAPWPQGTEMPEPEAARIYLGRKATVGASAIAAMDKTREPVLYDMLGNAREWTADVYRDDFPDVDESSSRKRGVLYAIRGLPLAERKPRKAHPAGLAFREALCGEGECLRKTAKKRATVGFRCVRPVP